MSGPDEKWTNGHTGEPYWRPSTAHEDRWLVIVGEPPQTVDGSVSNDIDPEDVTNIGEIDQRDVGRTSDIPAPIPVTRAQRLRNLMDAVRSGDKSAVDLLRQAMGGHDDDAA